MLMSALQSPYLGVESSVRNHLLREVMPLDRVSEVKKVLKVRLKFRGS